MPKIIAVMSGKGGVGKTSVAAFVTRILSEKHKTILLDFDICGPSMTTTFGIHGALLKTTDGFKPINVTENLDILSFGLALNPNDAVIWRGPKKLVFLDLFFKSASEYDYVIIDTPPGISEEHSFLVGKEVTSLIVTTPQNISLNDAQRCVEYCQAKKISILGILENMSSVKCECCQEVSHPFGAMGGSQLAAEYEIAFLGSLPIEPKLAEIMDNGTFSSEYIKLNSTTFIREILYENNVLEESM
ncbi:cytosolic Fe-S cluster assembly factor cfd1 [Glugoides intestinalis]